MQHNKENISKLIDEIIKGKQAMLDYIKRHPMKDDIKVCNNLTSSIRTLKMIKFIIDSEKEFKEFCEIYFD